MTSALANGFAVSPHRVDDNPPQIGMNDLPGFGPTLEQGPAEIGQVRLN